MSNEYPDNLQILVRSETHAHIVTIQHFVRDEVIQECFKYPKKSIENRIIHKDTDNCSITENMTIYWIDKDLNIGYADGQIDVVNNRHEHKTIKHMYKLGKEEDWEKYRQLYKSSKK